MLVVGPGRLNEDVLGADTHARGPGSTVARVVDGPLDGHSLTGIETDKTRAPTYEQIAQRPGRDRAYIRAFLDEDHFPMSTYRLLDAEKDDVAVMIASLKK